MVQGYLLMTDISTSYLHLSTNSQAISCGTMSLSVSTSVASDFMMHMHWHCGHWWIPIATLQHSVVITYSSDVRYSFVVLMIMVVIKHALEYKMAQWSTVDVSCVKYDRLTVWGYWEGGYYGEVQRLASMTWIIISINSITLRGWCDNHA